MPLLLAATPTKFAAVPRVPSAPAVGRTGLVVAAGRCCAAPVNSRPWLANPILMARARPPEAPVAITTLEDWPGVVDSSFRLCVPAVPSGPDSEACSDAAKGEPVMAVPTE